MRPGWKASSVAKLSTTAMAVVWPSWTAAAPTWMVSVAAAI
jgi:hypothetical protein